MLDVFCVDDPPDDPADDPHDPPDDDPPDEDPPTPPSSPRYPVYEDYRYSTLDDWNPNDTVMSEQDGYKPVPDGWELAPNDAASRNVAGSHPWFAPSPPPPRSFHSLSGACIPGKNLRSEAGRSVYEMRDEKLARNTSHQPPEVHHIFGVE